MKSFAVNLPRFKQTGLITWLAPLFLLSGYIILATLSDLRLAVPELTGLTGLLVMLLAVLLYQGERNQPDWPVWLILLIALLIRAPFLLRPPQLSDDIYRYLWDGLQLLSGRNPYALAPADMPAATEALQKIRDAVNHPQLVTIYGPAAQLFFALVSFFGRTIVGFKFALVLVDMACCYLLCRLLRRLRLRVWKSALYAWHPLPVLEIAGSGHIDGVGLFFLLAALLAVIRSQKNTDNSTLCAWIAGLLLSCSVLVKLFPAVFLPGILLIQKQHKKPLLIAFMLTTAALLFYFFPDITNGLNTLHTYSANWEFNSFFFRSLRSLLGSATMARLIIGAIFFGAVGWLYVRFSHILKTDMGENRTLAMLETSYILSLLYLLLTPTLHPWYGLYLVLLLPFAAGPCGLILSWSLFLGYQVMIYHTLLGQWKENDLSPFLTWVGPVAAFGLTMVSNKKGYFLRSVKNARNYSA